MAEGPSTWYTFAPLPITHPQCPVGAELAKEGQSLKWVLPTRSSAAVADVSGLPVLSCQGSHYFIRITVIPGMPPIILRDPGTRKPGALEVPCYNCCSILYKFFHAA